MHLRYYLNSEGKRVYTLKTVLEDGSYTLSAHPGILFTKIFKLEHNFNLFSKTQ